MFCNELNNACVYACSYNLWELCILPCPSSYNYIPILKTDGVHLNEGNRRLLTSISSALLFAENSYNGKKNIFEDKCFQFTYTDIVAKSYTLKYYMYILIL
jgi:hypothetical protein